MAHTEQDYVWKILDDVLVLLSGYGVPTSERTYKLDGGWGLALSDLKKAFAERDARIAELETSLKSQRAVFTEDNRLHMERAYKAESRIASLEAALAAARKALEKILEVTREEPSYYVDGARNIARAALDASRVDSTNTKETN